MYQFWLGEILLPIPPSKVSISYGNQNESISLVDGSEINIINSTGLRTIKFDALIPYREYPFAEYLYGFIDGDVYRENIEALKTNGTIFQFVITRQRGKKVFHYTDIRAAVEDITVTESTENGFDIYISLTLKEYKEFGAKFVTEQSTNTTAARQEDNAPQSGVTYTVVSNDSLWKIAKSLYGDGTKWKDIYNANTDVISNPNVIKVGMVLTIP